MLWLARPPFLRWFAAGAIVVAALAWDLSGRATVPHPYAARDIAVGDVLTDDVIEWRSVPADAFDVPDLTGAAARVAIPAGTPIVEAVVARGEMLPAGWWTVPLDVPTGTTPGTAVRVVAPDGSAVTGMVVRPAVRDGFGVTEPATVGFPPQVADLVARLAATVDLVVLVEG